MLSSFFYLVLIDNTRIKPLSSIVSENDTLKIQCISSAIPQWILEDFSTEDNGGESVPSEEKYLPSNVQVIDDSIIITNVKAYNKGYYICIGYNEMEELFSRSLVTVKGMYV